MAPPEGGKNSLGGAQIAFRRLNNHQFNLQILKILTIIIQYFFYLRLKALAAAPPH